MACASIDIVQQEGMEDGADCPLIKQYCAHELLPKKKPALHDLLQKEPAAMGVRLAVYPSLLGVFYPHLFKT